MAVEKNKLGHHDSRNGSNDLLKNTQTNQLNGFNLPTQEQDFPEFSPEIEQPCEV
jgi:hypothetical protein